MMSGSFPSPVRMRCLEGEIPPGFAASAPGACCWLVSLDFDGTLWEEQGMPIAAEFFELMQLWRSHGVRWGINTGRSLPYLLEDLAPCSPVLPDFICTCERYVYMAGEDRRLYPAKAYNDECHRANVRLREQLRPMLVRWMDELACEHPEWRWSFAERDPLSVEAADSATMDCLIPLLLPLADAIPGVAIQRAGRYLRFADARFSKGTALDYVRGAWKIPADRLFLMGDGHNDLDAFRAFPSAFCAAPPTAHPDVLKWLKSRSGYIACEPGVLPALRHWHQEYVASWDGGLAEGLLEGER